LHANDTPHAIALGVALATFVSVIPLPMSQTLVAIALAALFRANKAVCIPVVWVTNPVTAIPIYATCFAVGQFLMASPLDSGAETQLQQLIGLKIRLLDIEFWKQSFALILGMGAELWVGCAVVGAIMGVIGYFVARWAVTSHREHRRQRTVRRHLFRAKLRASQIAGAPV